MTVIDDPLDHDLVVVDEFDALSIEVKIASPAASNAPKEKYPAKLHARKVAKELGVTHGLVYLPGEPTRLFEDSDMGPAFRQRRYFYYISGANFENCAATYDLAADRLTLWIPYSDPRQVLWYGTTPGPADCKAAADVDDARYTRELGDYLAAHLEGGHPLFVLHEDQVPPLMQELDRQRRRRDPAAASSSRPVRIDTTKLLPAMDAARVIKTDYEVRMIRRANEVSSAAHRRVLARLRGMANEREIEAAFTAHCTAAGAKRQAYPVIAGSGANAGVLHYFANDEPLAGRQLVVLDAGAEWDCYASDVTRTFPISGRFTPEAAAVYAAVDRMQTESVARVRPGIAFRSVHLHAALVAVHELLRLGVLTLPHGATPRDVFLAGTVAAFFPHGLGHHVGLEVHDVASPALMRGGGGGGGGGGSSSSRDSDARERAAAPLPPPRFAPAGAGKREWLTADDLARLVREGYSAGIASSSPSSPSSPSTTLATLAPGMVVTVEPGLYFCRPYIEAFFLADPKHARYIDRAVLERYYPVGGVRIEDCVLVTEGGCENLTSAPRGEEALRIINRGSY